MQVLNNKQMRELYAKGYENTPIDDQLIVYETRDGQSIVDSPFALFLYLASTPAFDTYKHVWVIAEDNEQVKSVIPSSLLSKVEFVIRNSARYIECLLAAKYLVNNSTFQSFFAKREEQVYINTWHGTPLKYMGFDIPGNPAHSQNVLRNLLMTDFLLTPNAHTTKIFSESYRMKGIYPGAILEGGYPRIDLTWQTDARTVKQELIDLKLDLDPTLPTILYMPTWRGSAVNAPIANLKQTLQELRYLRSAFAGVYNVLVKVHPYVYSEAAKLEALVPFLVPDYLDANRVLALVDILVTDFSSVFFDYLVTDKPIIFYSWDADLYEDERGMYLPLDSLPGPLTRTVEQLCQRIKTVAQWRADYEERYQSLKKQMVCYDDGQVTERVVERIFKGTRFPEQINEVRLVNDLKKILIYGGGMKNNGITSSLLNLLHAINYERFDVTLFSQSPNEATLENYQKIPKAVRLVFKPGAPIYQPEEEQYNGLWQRNESSEKLPVQAYQRETRRLFSGLSFDYAIDFSGYSFYWAKFIAFVDAKRRAVFQHNDLWLDAHKKINGKQPHLNNLMPLFKLYSHFEQIVNVSQSLAEVNLAKLSQFMEKNQVRVVMNGLNVERIFGQEDAVPERVSTSKRVSFQFVIDREYCFTLHPDITNLAEQTEQGMVTVADQLVAVARAQVGDEIYYKLLKDDCYIGWSKASELPQEKQPVILERVRLEQVASFKRHKNFPIYADLPTGKEQQALRGWSQYIDGMYVWVKEKVTTMVGEYYHLFGYRQSLGWVEKAALANFHQVHSWSPLNLYFWGKNKRKGECLPTLIKMTDLQAQFSQEQPVAIYTEPVGIKGSLLKSDSFPVTTLKNYEVTKIMDWQKQDWYYLAAEGHPLGWISASDIEGQLTVSKNSERQSESFVEQVEKLRTATGVNYVMMGRFSPEKNHKSLITAFAELVKNDPDSRLFLIGEGALKEQIEQQAYQLGLSERVFFLGQLENPFPVLKLMDIFVLPSLYEGQPMVLLESLTLGLKVLASNIPQNIEVLQNGKLGMVLDGIDATSIAKGLSAIREKTNYPSFDYKTYNQIVQKQFEDLLEET